MNKKVIKKLLMMAPLVLASVSDAAPMDDAFTLLDNGGAIHSGRSSTDGYYIVAMGLSDRSSDNKASEEARLEAIKHLSTMINGVTTSGHSSAHFAHSSMTSNGESTSFSEEAFVDVINTSFKGHLGAAKTIKQGRYGNDYFVAIAITESDVGQIGSLRTLQSTSDNRSNSSSYNNATIIIGDSSSVASFNNDTRQVEAKGLGTMKSGEARARELALMDAMRNAVQQVQGVMIQGKSGSFGEALSFALSSKTEGYVSSYEIIDEDIARGSYQVTLVAQVNSGQLLGDINFYLDLFDDPVFAIDSGSNGQSDWLTNELERLGFTLNSQASNATHSFVLQQRQTAVENHHGVLGYETTLTVKLKDKASGEVLFTIMNAPVKTRIFVQPLSRSKMVSQASAYKQLQKQLGPEVITALADYAKRGRNYKIEIHNARRSDWQMFKTVLENGTGGTVKSWDWSKDGKVMILNFNYGGQLSQAMDEGLEQLYQTYRTAGKGRRPTAINISRNKAVFEIVN